MDLSEFPKPCEDCEEVYGESRNYGGTHWHCANCKEVSSMMGHYRSEAGDFKCKKRD